MTLLFMIWDLMATGTLGIRRSRYQLVFIKEIPELLIHVPGTWGEQRGCFHIAIRAKSQFYLENSKKSIIQCIIFIISNGAGCGGTCLQN